MSQRPEVTMTQAAIVEGSIRLPDDQIGPTPPADERRFLAVTIRKVEELEAQIAALMNEARSYTGVDKRRLDLAGIAFEAGALFLEQTLRRVEITDDGK